MLYSCNILFRTLRDSIRTKIGAFASPDVLVYSDLPKTRSGKIMRRILRKIACKNEGSLGDITTLADPSVSYYFIVKSIVLIHYVQVVPKLMEQFKIANNK